MVLNANEPSQECALLFTCDLSIYIYTHKVSREKFELGVDFANIYAQLICINLRIINVFINCRFEL